MIDPSAKGRQAVLFFALAEFPALILHSAMFADVTVRKDRLTGVRVAKKRVSKVTDSSGVSVEVRDATVSVDSSARTPFFSLNLVRFGIPKFTLGAQLPKVDETITDRRGRKLRVRAIR